MKQDYRLTTPDRWTNKQRNSPRPLWFQLGYPDGSQRNTKKFMSIESAFHHGDILMGANPDAECLFLIDGRVLEEDLIAPPIRSFWNRWERYEFVENGKPCTLLRVEGLKVEVLR